MSRERTMMADKDGSELFLGDVVRADVHAAYREFGVHGDWAEYEITKAPGGYALTYLRSEKGAVLPYGYLSCFLTEFDQEALLPDLKRVMFARDPIPHPSLSKCDDPSTAEERRAAFAIEAEQRRARSEARPSPAPKDGGADV